MGRLAGGAMVSLSIILGLASFICIAYFYLLLAASYGRQSNLVAAPKNRFAFLIAAHDEGQVIGATLHKLRAVDYPPKLHEIHVVADYCSDQTAEVARAAGANVHERREGEQGKKSAALHWLYQRLEGGTFDAVVILDADARIDVDFLRAMNEGLLAGHTAIQGQQRISNPRSGWYAAMTSAMYKIDNLVHNQGRSNVGGSARHMGDSLCLRKDIVDKTGFGSGLTEDHVLRQRLLLAGERIHYEPRAISYNEAASTWRDARVQRTRWMQGTIEADRENGLRLMRLGWRWKSFPLFEAGFEAILPSFSTLAVVTFFFFAAHALFGPRQLVGLWAGLVGLIGIFPFVGLVLAKASLRDFVALFMGPIFLVWRVYLSLSLRWLPRDVTWVRTPRRVSQ